MTNFEKIIEFHKAFDIPLNEEPTVALMELRETLEEEEHAELMEEFDHYYETGEVRANFVKELVDKLYITYGTAAALGIDIDAAFSQVHESNMSKLGLDGKPIKREDGKVLKGPNYFSPDMAGFI